MATQNLTLTDKAVDIVSALNLTRGGKYTLQVIGPLPADYSEAAADSADMPGPRHFIPMTTPWNLSVPAAGKVWMAAHGGGKTEIAVTEA